MTVVFQNISTEAPSRRTVPDDGKDQNTEGSRLTMSQLKIFRLYDGAKNDMHSIESLLGIVNSDLFPG